MPGRTFDSRRPALSRRPEIEGRPCRCFDAHIHCRCASTQRGRNCLKVESQLSGKSLGGTASCEIAGQCRKERRYYKRGPYIPGDRPKWPESLQGIRCELEYISPLFRVSDPIDADLDAGVKPPQDRCL